MTRPPWRPWVAGTMAVLWAACATTGAPPAELGEARVSLEELTEGPTGQLAPEAYKEAQEALAAAESAQRGGARPTTVRDLAYVAKRKAERAAVLARVAQGTQAQAETEVQREARLVEEQLRRKRELEAARERSTTSAEELRAREQALAEAEARLEEQRRQLAEQHRRLGELATQQQEAAAAQARLAEEAQRAAAEAETARRDAEAQARALEQERQARARAEADARAHQAALAAEQRARERAEAEAARALQRVAQVREEARGLVVTLAGPLLFESNSAILTPQAQQTLAQVAQVLREGDQPLLVEGHTDARGNDRANEALSEKRAQVVRDFLVSQGIPPRRVQARGYGEYRPIASNATPRGREQNRRVEIVITRERPSGFGGGGAPEPQEEPQEEPQD